MLVALPVQQGGGEGFGGGWGGIGHCVAALLRGLAVQHNLVFLDAGEGVADKAQAGDLVRHNNAADQLLHRAGRDAPQRALGRVARAFQDGEIAPERWKTMSDDEVRTELIRLRGVGPWTADMMLIFYLHRPDVLPLEDIGLIKSAARLYGWDTVSALRDHAELWRPWRTVATWYIWRDLDAEPVIY